MPLSQTAIHYVSAVIWSPDKLQHFLGAASDDALVRHNTVVIELPHDVVEQIADSAITKTCAVVELRGKRFDMRYALLTIQTGDKQLVLVAPLASGVMRHWLLEGTRPDGRYRFLAASPGAEVLTALNVPYVGKEGGAALFRESLDVAIRTADQFTPRQHARDLLKVSAVAELRGKSASLLDGHETRDRYIATVIPTDWRGVKLLGDDGKKPRFLADAAIIVQ